MNRLGRDFYARDTVAVACDLLGCVLVHDGPEGRLRGRIVETEAYEGEDDPACHAAAGRTGRTRPLYGSPGHAYVYLIYGMYHCLNAVTRPPSQPSAVLVRAVEPLEGLETMRARRSIRRSRPISDRDLTNGPGKLCEAFGLTLAHNELDLTADRLWIEPGTPPTEIGWTPRVGIRVGTDRLWRCFDRESTYVSRSPFNMETNAR